MDNGNFVVICINTRKVYIFPELYQTIAVLNFNLILNLYVQQGGQLKTLFYMSHVRTNTSKYSKS